MFPVACKSLQLEQISSHEKMLLCLKQRTSKQVSAPKTRLKYGALLLSAGDLRTATTQHHAESITLFYF